MAAHSFLSRQERFALVGSTNDVVREWLAGGVREVCLAVADEQTAGRGREGRTWQAPRRAALLASLGFRPSYLPPETAWRLAATVSLAMADAAEDVAGLPDRAIKLKWPNDLVIASDRGGDGALEIRKLAGVLGETDGLGGPDPRVVVGIGINGDWRASDFPPELRETMTSLREASGGRPVDLAPLLAAFLTRLEARVSLLRSGRFELSDWVQRQVTTGRLIRLETPDGAADVVRGIGVDPMSGALLVEDRAAPNGPRPILSGEVRHVRLVDDRTAGAADAADAAGAEAVGV
jgi:BirA family biotin operon repressor/biotin-[acetyl-CoA-carboxylase] ligase